MSSVSYLALKELKIIGSELLFIAIVVDCSV